MIRRSRWSDNFPAGLTASWTSVAAGGASGNSDSSGSLADTLNMPAGSSVTYIVTADIASSATGTLINTATATESVTDNDQGNNSASDNDTVLTPMADLSIVMSDSPDPVIQGGELSYSFTVRNDGPSTAQGTEVVFSLDSGLIPATVSAENLGTLLPGEVREFDFALTVLPGTVGTITSSATVSSVANDPVAGNDSATESTTIKVIDPHGLLLDTNRVPGNVVAYLSGSDLILIPDAHDNGVLISPDAAGNVLVTGVGGTTINGSTIPFPVSSSGGGVLPEDLTVVGSAGSDLISLLDVTVTGNAIISGGSEIDSIYLSGVIVGGNLRLSEDAGNGFIDVIDSTITGVAQLLTGAGDNEVTVENSNFGNVFSFTGGAERDTLALTTVEISDATQIRPGNGVNTIDLTDTNHGSTLYLLAGPGADSVRGNDVDVESALYLSTGAGNDVIDFDNLHAMGTAIVQPGAGDDEVRFLNSQFVGLVNMFLASGDNVVDLQGNDFDDRAYVQTFSGALAARLIDNTFASTVVLRGGSSGRDILVDDAADNTYNGPSPLKLGFEHVDAALRDTDFEDLLSAAFPPLLP